MHLVLWFNIIVVYTMRFFSIVYCYLQELAITSDEALSLEELPKHAVVLGGGSVPITKFAFSVTFKLICTPMISYDYSVLYKGTLLWNLLQYGEGWELLWIYVSEKNSR